MPTAQGNNNSRSQLQHPLINWNILHRRKGGVGFTSVLLNLKGEENT
jgi:hypothetical protein